ncbi:unnamed protein product [Fraxinus pennsylvanica]|uniref:Alpha/beta hydrolase fold-3 domain-containing protein n=1 Tax=Fraxinus pennsylvanica TaxID=56036 RepID=A0AAD1ZJJ5_9LAMI|nr:unnamed protein product [Fraxinus pennsylvanica]
MNTVIASNTTKEVLIDLSSLIKVYKDGIVERLMGTPNIPPSPEDPTTGVASKDSHLPGAAEAKALIISVQYGLAPEHLLPIAYEDSWTALQWVASCVIANTSIEKC